MQRRLKAVQEVRDYLGVDVQAEVKAMTREKRAALLKEIAFPVIIPKDHTLAIKANLAIPWNKLRVLSR